MKNKIGNVCVILGAFLVVFALILTAFNLYESWRAEQSAKEAASKLEEYLPSDTNEKLSLEQGTPADGSDIEIPDYLLNPEMKMPVKDIDGVEYIGMLRIPALELELPVISEWSYPNLKIAPCRYDGSAYLDNLVLCGHNYSSHFGSLKNLWPGDSVTFTDMDGNEFCYEVVELETLQPGAVDEMESGDWDLTLFTCTLGGASRVTVRCEKSE